jgi:predicted nuclease of restriction endonuclease-like (RecB) superfamily
MADDKSILNKSEDSVIISSQSEVFISEVRKIIEEARNNAVRSVDFCRVQMYWNIGRRIVEEEQLGNERAEYGAYLIKNLAKDLEPEYGTGFSVRQLERARQFYRLYPIASAVRTQLNWSQYKQLIAIEDPDKREYYELESVNNCWTGRELERQINSLLYERLLLSNDKESVLAVARKQRIPQSPREIIKDPMVLEFLGLERKPTYYESDLETSLINHLQNFMLELGNGFAFVARQKRVLIEDDEFFIDLVFYNRLLRCFVLFELKTDKLTHQDLGQLQMYVNYYDRVEKLPEENPTIGILLCTSKNDTVVKMSLPENNSTILASQYTLYLPSEEQLKKEVEEVKNLINKGGLDPKGSNSTPFGKKKGGC